MGKMCQEAGKADIVGLTTTAATYHTALKVARAAKKNNPLAKVILGGPQAAALSDEILMNRGRISDDYCVDVVCYGDGVSSFVDGILGDVPLQEVPNICYLDKDAGAFHRTGMVREDISLWPVMDFSFFDMPRITGVYGEKFKGITSFKRGLGVISGFGCAAKKQCGFCARADRKLRHRNVESFWKEVSAACKKWRVEYVFDLADSILDDPCHLRKMIDAKPKDINPQFRVFARADQLANHEHHVDLLKKLSVYEVFIGFESGSREMLRAMNKNTTPEQNLAAAKALGENDIYIVGCFVLGAPGESVATLEESVRHAESLQKISHSHLLVCGASPVNVLPGSPWFSLIKNVDGIRGQDDLDKNLLRRIWYKNYCHVSCEQVEEYAERIRTASGAAMQYEKGTDRK